MVKGTRDALVAAAAALMDEGGLRAVTLRAVGRRAGVSHNAPYKHFANKEELLAAVAARELLRHQRASTSVADGETPDQAVKTLMHGYISWAVTHPVRFKLTFGTWSGDSAELSAAAATARIVLVTAVARAQKAGTLPAGDPERVMALLMAVAHGAVDLFLAGHLSVSGKGHASPHDLLDDLFRYFHTGPAGESQAHA
ncbi:MAG: TetR/AcrR family transcriptional regulator [Dehalococcoidia bacterium]